MKTSHPILCYFPVMAYTRTSWRHTAHSCLDSIFHTPSACVWIAVKWDWIHEEGGYIECTYVPVQRYIRLWSFFDLSTTFHKSKLFCWVELENKNEGSWELTLSGWGRWRISRPTFGMAVRKWLIASCLPSASVLSKTDAVCQEEYTTLRGVCAASPPRAGQKSQQQHVQLW